MVFKGFSYFVNGQGKRYYVKDITYDFSSKEKLIDYMRDNAYKFIGDKYIVGNKENCIAFGRPLNWNYDEMVVIDSFGT